MAKSNRRKGEPYSGHELVNSRLTRHVQTFPGGAAVYEHKVPQMAGAYVVLWPGVTGPLGMTWGGWDTFDTFQDAKRAIIIGA